MMGDGHIAVAQWYERHGVSNDTRAVRQYYCGFWYPQWQPCAYSAQTELFPVFATLLPCQGQVSSICKASLLHRTMSKGCKLAMLPLLPVWQCLYLSSAESQRYCWGAVRRRGAACAGSGNPRGMGKADSVLLLVIFSIGSKACGDSRFLLLPQWDQIGVEAVWNPIDQLFRKCQESCNTFFFFFYWSHERMKCFSALRGVLAQQFSTFFSEWRHYKFSGLCILSLNLLATSLPFLSIFQFGGWTALAYPKRWCSSCSSCLLYFLSGDDVRCLPPASTGSGSTGLQHDHLDHNIRGLKKGEKGITWCLFL